MNFHTIVKDGIAKVYAQDFQAQSKYIDFICNKVRRMDSTIIYDAEGIFIPNDDYMLEYFGPLCLNKEFNLYLDSKRCVWLGNLILPIKDLSGTIVGLAGFDPKKYIEAHETKDWSLYYYSYSTKEVFQKGNYLYTLSGIYENAIKDGYILLVDGLFDCLSLIAEGYNAAALMGSSPTEQIIAQLRFINKVILLPDNDNAGNKLEKTLRNKLNNFIYFRQGITKDVDELLKTDKKEQFRHQLDNVVKESIMLNRCMVFK